MSIFKKVTPLELLQANDVKIAQLQTTNESLDVLQADNTKIITNFENLLS